MLIFNIPKFYGFFLNCSNPVDEKILPVDIKYGILNFPDKTLVLKLCKVLPSKGKAPQTKT